MSPFSILLELRMTEVVVTTGATRRAKLQSNHHHRQTNTQFFYRPDALPVTQPTVSKHWRERRHSGTGWHKSTWKMTVKMERNGERQNVRPVRRHSSEWLDSMSSSVDATDLVTVQTAPVLPASLHPPTSPPWSQVHRTMSWALP